MAHLLLREAGGTLSLDPPVGRVWRLRYGGNTEKLFETLGQKQFAARVHDYELALSMQAFLLEKPAFKSDGLQHRFQEGVLAKLGNIIFDMKVSQVQRDLYSLKEDLDPTCEKEDACFPSWASGSHVFVPASCAREVEAELKGSDLKPCDIIVAETYRHFTDKAIEEQPKGGKSIYLKEQHSMNLPLVNSDFHWRFCYKGRRLVTRPESLSSRGTQSTGQKKAFSLVNLPKKGNAQSMASVPPEGPPHEFATPQRGEGKSMPFVPDGSLQKFAEQVAEKYLTEFLNDVRRVARPPPSNVYMAMSSFSDWVVAQMTEMEEIVVRPFVQDVTQEFMKKCVGALEQRSAQLVNDHVGSYLDAFKRELFREDVIFEYLRLDQRTFDRYKDCTCLWSEMIGSFAKDFTITRRSKLDALWVQQFVASAGPEVAAEVWIDVERDYIPIPACHKQLARNMVESLSFLSSCREIAAGAWRMQQMRVCLEERGEGEERESMQSEPDFAQR